MYLFRHILGHRILGIERVKVLAHRAVALGALAPLREVGSRNVACTVGVGLDDAGIDGESLTLNQAFAHATAQHCLEDEAQCIALAEAAVAILGDGRVIGHSVLEAKATEPAIGQVEMDFLAQPTLGSDA